MKSYADCLREDAKTLNSGRLTVRTTPQFGVAWLVAEVEGRTGEPYHGEIALLMNSYFHYARTSKEVQRSRRREESNALQDRRSLYVRPAAGNGTHATEAKTARAPET